MSNFFENGAYTSGYVLKPQLNTPSTRLHELDIRVVSTSNIMWNDYDYELLEGGTKVLMAFYGKIGNYIGSSDDMKCNTNTQLHQATDELFGARFHSVFRAAETMKYFIRDIEFAFIYL